MSLFNSLSSLSLLAVFDLAGCSSQAPQPLKKGEKAIDVASVVRQKLPASVKDRDAWAKDLATTFESQGLAPTMENVCSVLAVAQQESNYRADPAVQSEEHTSELQSRFDLVCRLLLEKKKYKNSIHD